MSIETLPTDPWLKGIEGESVPRLIATPATTVRVVAGPGSGKTTGLKRRVWRLIEADGVAAESIFVGTFTRAIAADLESELGAYTARGVTVSTLHSQALALLRDNQHVLAGRTLRFLLEFEEICMLYDVKRRLDDKRRISQLRKELKRLQAAHAERRTYPDAHFHGAIDRWLREHEAMMIGEVVPLATQALEGGGLRRGMFDHVIVDEYQDLTHCEQELVELLWSGAGSLVVLGDDDQSIYGFRYNHPDGISSFMDRHSDVDDIPIAENRRSGRNIVVLANTMMQEGGSKKEPMVPMRRAAGIATCVYWPSVEDEIVGLGRYLKENDDQSFLVLVPRRFIGYALRDEIGSAARTAFHQEVLEHPLLEERFCLATLLTDGDDKAAARAWLGFHAQGGRAQGRNSPAYLHVFDPECSPSRLMAGIVDQNLRPRGSGQQNIQSRASLLLELVDAAPSDVPEIIDYVFDNNLASAVEDSNRARVTHDLQRLNEAAHQGFREQPDEGLKGVVDRLRYRIATRAPLVDEEESARVRIMTLHSAKGLEADVIVMAGAADQIIPGLATSGKERGEQRRLLYVALTRARNELIISWPNLVELREAKANGIRVDPNSVFTDDAGLRQVRLARSSLLPTGDCTPQSGHQWLAASTLR